jgi:hypothetical protein
LQLLFVELAESLEWLRRCNDEFLLSFLGVGAFHFPFQMPFEQASRWYFFRRWRRGAVLEQVLGQRRAEMI